MATLSNSNFIRVTCKKHASGCDLINKKHLLFTLISRKGIMFRRKSLKFFLILCLTLPFSPTGFRSHITFHLFVSHLSTSHQHSLITPVIPYTTFTKVQWLPIVLAPPALFTSHTSQFLLPCYSFACMPADPEMQQWKWRRNIRLSTTTRKHVLSRYMSVQLNSITISPICLH